MPLISFKLNKESYANFETTPEVKNNIILSESIFLFLIKYKLNSPSAINKDRTKFWLTNIYNHQTIYFVSRNSESPENWLFLKHAFTFNQEPWSFDAWSSFRNDHRLVKKLTKTRDNSSNFRKIYIMKKMDKYFDIKIIFFYFSYSTNNFVIS